MATSPRDGFVFDIVRAIREGIPIESTWAFVGLIAFLAATAAGTTAWLVDRTYKNGIASSLGTVQIQFDMFGEPLPLSIEPRSSINVIHLTEDYRAEAGVHFNNSHEAAIPWPSSEKQSKERPFIPRIRMSATGIVEMLNVIVKLRFMATDDGLPGGSKHVYETLLPFDLSPEGNPKVIYVFKQNLSQVWTTWFAPTAEVQMRGENKRRSVPVTFTGPNLYVSERHPTTKETIWIGVFMVGPDVIDPTSSTPAETSPPPSPE